MKTKRLTILLILFCSISVSYAQYRDADSLSRLSRLTNGGIPLGSIIYPEWEKRDESRSHIGGVYVDGVIFKGGDYVAGTRQPIHGIGSCSGWMPFASYYWMPGVCENPYVQFDVPTDLAGNSIHNILYSMHFFMSDGFPIGRWKVEFQETTIGKYSDYDAEDESFEEYLEDYGDDDDYEIDRKIEKFMNFEGGLLHGNYTIECKRGLSNYSSIFRYRETFDHGTGDYLDVFPNGETMIEGRLVNGRQDGEWRFYNRSKPDLYGITTLHWVLVIQYDMGAEVSRQWFAGDSIPDSGHRCN